MISSKFIYIIKYIWRTEKKYILLRVPEIILRAVEPFIAIIFPKIIIDKLLSDQKTFIFTDVLKIIFIMLATNLIVKISLRVLDTCITNAYNSFDAKHMINIGEKIISLEFKNIEDKLSSYKGLVKILANKLENFL